MDDTPRIVTVARDVAADADALFELVADPAQQPSWDGNDNLASAEAGQRVRRVGDVFRTTLTLGSVRENHVLEFEEGRRIAWQPSEVDAPPPGHLWRWEFEPPAPAPPPRTGSAPRSTAWRPSPSGEPPATGRCPRCPGDTIEVMPLVQVIIGSTRPPQPGVVGQAGRAGQLRRGRGRRPRGGGAGAGAGALGMRFAGHVPIPFVSQFVADGVFTPNEQVEAGADGLFDALAAVTRS